MNNEQFCPIGKLERILVATDRSQFSDGAITEAINLAKNCSTMLYVLTTIELNLEYETIGSNFFQKEKAKATQYLESIKKGAAEEGVACETILHSGIEPYQAIMGEAAKRDIDIIVVGRHGRKSLLKTLMGEVATKIVAHAPCKVLVVPKAAKVEYRSILIATDGSGHSIVAAQEAIGIAKRCGGSIIALSSIRSDDEFEKAQANVNKVLDMAKSEGIMAEGLVPTGRSYNVIIEIAEGRGVNLIVMGIPVKSALQKIFTGSATEQVIGKAGGAVLIVKVEDVISSTV